MSLAPVPSPVDGATFRRETPAGTVRVVVNTTDGDPVEVFILLGRAGSEVQSFCEALGRVISLYLRSDGTATPAERLQAVADQLVGIGGANQVGWGPDRVLSVIDAVGQVLAAQRTATPAAAPASPTANTPTPVPPSRAGAPTMDLCPECNAAGIVRQEGCWHCVQCGWSRC
jgi:ribonucleoside-diphosphate reductase alpha chain